jgi:hypothetical protein
LTLSSSELKQSVCGCAALLGIDSFQMENPILPPLDDVAAGGLDSGVFADFCRLFFSKLTGLSSRFAFTVPACQAVITYQISATPRR